MPVWTLFGLYEGGGVMRVQYSAEISIVPSSQRSQLVDKNYDAVTAVGQRRSLISDTSEWSRVLVN